MLFSSTIYDSRVPKSNSTRGFTYDKIHWDDVVTQQGEGNDQGMVYVELSAALRLGKSTLKYTDAAANMKTSLSVESLFEV
jgi:hypothetical protein